MIKEFHIKNYALIDDLRVDPNHGLCILTGETGAGKSIIIGALGALLGEKVDKESIRAGTSSITVEGRFSTRLKKIEEFLERIGIEPQEEIIVRRRILKNGKSMNYINDSQVSLNTLKKLGDLLVDIHGQHQHQSLLNTDLHLELLDRFLGLQTLRDELKKHYKKFLSLREDFSRLIEDVKRRKEKRDLYQFQIEEIDKANLKLGELEELLNEKKLLETAEKRYLLIGELRELLSEKDNSALQLLQESENRLEELSKIDKGLKSQLDALRNASVITEDVWRYLVDYQERIEFSQERLEEVNQRLYLLDNLKKKYGNTIEEILSYRERIEKELSSLQIDEENIEKLKEEMNGEIEKSIRLAEELSERRRKGKERLEKRIGGVLKTLGMPASEFLVDISHKEDPSGLFHKDGKTYHLDERGIDRVEFFFSANPGEPPRPLRKVASGGELSRIMLAIKSVLLEVDEIPIMVFDEIDSGIGGRIAEAVGKKLSLLGRYRQILCITHLPQIAKYANVHYKVYKETKGGRTFTKLEKLSKKKRVEELARMLSGERITPTTLKHAQELLDGVQ